MTYHDEISSCCSLPGTRTATCMQLGYLRRVGSNLDCGSWLSNRVLFVPSCSWPVWSLSWIVSMGRLSWIVYCDVSFLFCTGTLVVPLRYIHEALSVCVVAAAGTLFVLTRHVCLEHLSYGFCRRSLISGSTGKMWKYGPPAQMPSIAPQLFFSVRFLR